MLKHISPEGVKPLEELGKGFVVVKKLKKIMDIIKGNVEREYGEMHLTGTQGMLMGTLVHFGKMKISDLSENMGLSNSTVSVITDRLVKQGLIDRTRSSEDRRVVYVSVTSKFKEKVKRHFEEIEKRFGNAVNRAAPPEDLDKIIEGLSILERLLESDSEYQN